MHAVCRICMHDVCRTCMLDVCASNVCSPFKIALCLQTWCDHTVFANSLCVILYAVRVCVQACKASFRCGACVLCANVCGLSGACCVCCLCVGDLSA